MQLDIIQRRAQSVPLLTHIDLVEQLEPVGIVRTTALAHGLPNLPGDSVTFRKARICPPLLRRRHIANVMHPVGSFPVPPSISDPTQALLAYSSQQLDDLVARAVGSPCIGRGHQASVFEISEIPELVLRIDDDVAAHRIKKPLRCVVVHYDAGLADLAIDDHFGLPRVVFVSIDHPCGERLTPKELQRIEPKIAFQVLNRCTGISIAQSFAKTFDRFAQKLVAKHAHKAATDGIINIGTLSDNDRVALRNHVRLYQDALKSTAALPQDIFDQGVAAIRRIHESPNEVRVSLTHGGNLLIDPKNIRLGFVDLNFQGSGSRGSLEEFAMVLVGRHRATAPWLFVINEEELRHIRPAMEAIIRKIDGAAFKAGMVWQNVNFDVAGFISLADRLELLLPRRCWEA